MPSPVVLLVLFRHLLGDAYEALPEAIRSVAGALMALPPAGHHDAIEIIIDPMIGAGLVFAYDGTLDSREDA
jgi:hypothetical protein